jgi:hypothetical protein
MSDPRKYIEELRAIFHGVADAQNWVDCPDEIESGIMSPPSYMARLALSVVGGFPIFAGAEKREWITQLVYRDMHFELKDWKRATWDIYGEAKTAESQVAGRELKKKIQCVASLMDGKLSEELRQDIAGGRFFLNNPYPKIRHAYKWFRKKSCASVSSSQQKPTGQRGGRLLVRRLIVPTENRALYGYAMVGFYYSLLESLFNVFYALGDRSFDETYPELPPGERFYQYRRESWAERFKAVLPIGQSSELDRLYEQLRRLKMDLRDELFHGFDGDENLLVPLQGVGLVPISYKSLTRSVHFSSVSGDAQLIGQALDVFDKFDAWLYSNPPWAFYVEYAESGFEIPFSGRRLDEVRAVIEEGAEAVDEWLAEESLQRDLHSW